MFQQLCQLVDSQAVSRARCARPNLTAGWHDTYEEHWATTISRKLQVSKKVRTNREAEVNEVPYIQKEMSHNKLNIDIFWRSLV